MKKCLSEMYQFELADPVYAGYERKIPLIMNDKVNTCDLNLIDPELSLFVLSCSRSLFFIQSML